MNELIAFAGRAGSGKTYAADHLVSQHGFTRIKFADPLKGIYRSWLRQLGFTQTQIEMRVEGCLKELHDKEFVRRQRQSQRYTTLNLATLPEPLSDTAHYNFDRVVVDDVLENPELCTPRRIMQRIGTEWGRETQGDDFWVRMWAETVRPLDKVVCDDCRFDNEVQFVRGLGGTVVKILGEPTTQSDHVSEKFDFEVDCTVRNTFDPFFLALIEGCIGNGRGHS